MQSRISSPQLHEWTGLQRPSIAGTFLLLSLFLAPVVFAQGPYFLSGSVKQPDGFPASRVTVSITGSTGLNWQAFSDDMGRYDIPNLPRGRYYLTVANPSDPDQYMDQVVIDLGRDMTTRVTVNLYLRYRSKRVERFNGQSGVVSLAEQMLRAPKQARKTFDQAVAYRSKHKYAQSLDSFNKAIQIYPEYCQAIAERGHLHIAMNQPALAAKDFARALEIIPGFGPALRGAGLCEFQQGHFAEAIGYLRRAVNAETGNATNYLFIGAASIALDQREQARASLQKALNMDPVGSARAHVHLANLCIKENRLKEAIVEIEAYLKVMPKAPDAEHLREVISQLRAGSGQP